MLLTCHRLCDRHTEHVTLNTSHIVWSSRLDHARNPRLPPVQFLSNYRCTLVFFWIPPSALMFFAHLLPPFLFGAVATRHTLERLATLYSVGPLTSARRVASAFVVQPSCDGDDEGGRL